MTLRLRFMAMALALVSTSVLAQSPPDVRALPSWSAPLYWAPSVAPSRPEPEALRAGEGKTPSPDRPFQTSIAAPPAMPFVAISPCRQYDSRNSSPLLQGVSRTVLMTDTPCFIPANALAVSANVTIFNISGGAPGNGVFEVGNVLPPSTSWINYPTTETQRSNAGILALDGAGNATFRVLQGGGQVDFLIDVNGYYADIGSPRAYALVNRSPAFQGTSKGFTAVSSPGTGKYCLSVAAGVPTNLPVQVTPDWGASSGNSLLAFHDHGLSFCSAGQIEVLTYDTSGNLSANVAFNVLVP